MPANKNALLRYHTLDRCLRRGRTRRYSIDDLVEACSDALADAEGIYRGVSVRTVQHDLQMMRSDRLGYNAPIEVYDGRYYRYADPSYTIGRLPLDAEQLSVVADALRLLAYGVPPVDGDARLKARAVLRTVKEYI